LRRKPLLACLSIFREVIKLPRMTTDFRLVVFDVDGTLVDSLSAIRAAMAGAASGAGLAEPPAEQVRQVIGLPLIVAIARIFPEESSAVHERLAQGYKESFWALTGSGTADDVLFPGIIDCLDQLDAAGYLLGIATGKGRHGLDTVLERHSLAGRFVTLQTADLGAGKPSPDMLLRAMSEAGTGPMQTLMVGDTTYDMEMAVAAGARAIGVAWGYHDAADLHSAGAHTVVENAAAIAPLAGALFGAAKRP